jgi:type II secretory pathway pseudopilin PulG
VIAIIGILATLVLTNFQGAQAKGRDTVRKNDINSIYQKLEEFYNEQGGYPDAALATTTFTGIDAGALTDADGSTISSTFQAGATPVPAPTVDNDPAVNGAEYAYAGYSGCATPATGASCGKYVLRAYLEREAVYSKSSLN